MQENPKQEMLKGKTVAVIGGSGFIGSYLCTRLVALECVVISLNRQISKKRISKVKYCSCDIRNEKEISDCLINVDLVFLVAAKTNFWGSYSDFFETNYEGAVNTVKACLIAGVKHLVYTSTPSVAYSAQKDINGEDESIGYAEQYDSPYAKTKSLAEKYVLKANSTQLQTIAIRPHLVWGIGDPHIVPRILESAIKRRLKRIGSLDYKVDMTHVDNAVEAQIKAASALLQPKNTVSGKAYFISDDAPVFIWSWINNLLELLGEKKIVKHISKRVAMVLALFMEVKNKTISKNTEPKLSRFLVNQLTHHHYFNIEAAKKELGYTVVKKPEEALAEYVEHLKISRGQHLS